jgi:hypothetical protein
MPWTPWIKVVETDMAPKTRIAGGLFLALDGYRQRCRYLSRLKTTQEWTEYLNALVRMHFPDGQQAPCCLKGSRPSIYAALAKILYGRPN